MLSLYGKLFSNLWGFGVLGYYIRSKLCLLEHAPDRDPLVLRAVDRGVL